MVALPLIGIVTSAAHRNPKRLPLIAALTLALAQARRELGPAIGVVASGVVPAMYLPR